MAEAVNDLLGGALDTKNAELKRLRKALAPFAKIAADYRRRCSEVDHSALVQVTLGVCVRAEMALSSQDGTRK